MFNNPAKKDPVKSVKESFNWTLDEDMIDSGRHLKAAESLVGSKLSINATKNGGMDMIDFYDNNKRVFERDTPQGNTWWKPHAELEKERAAEKKADIKEI